MAGAPRPATSSIEGKGSRVVSRSRLRARAAAASGLRPERPRAVSAVRLTQNPLITVHSSPSLGDNVNGPSIIRVPSWISAPARPLLHLLRPPQGPVHSPCLCRRESLGPWTIYEPGVVPVGDTAFFRPQAGSAWRRCRSVLHARGVTGDLRGPDAQTAGAVDARMVDRGAAAGRRTLPARRAWGAGRAATASSHSRAKSSDGLHFQVTRADHQGQLSPRVFRSTAISTAWPASASLLRSKDPLGRVRRRSESVRGRPVRRSRPPRRGRPAAAARCMSFSRASATRPRRVMLSTINLTGDWTTWKASAPVEVAQAGGEV